MPSNCSLAEARTRCVRRFLQGDWSHLFFIDDDIGFSGPVFRHMLTSGLDVVAAAAPYRSDDIKHQGGFTVDREDVGVIDGNGFAPVKRIGAGFMCISRAAIDKMAKSYCAPEFFALSLSGDTDCMVEEDHAFCERWQSIGGTVYIDTLAELDHQGTKVYRKSFRDYLLG